MDPLVCEPARRISEGPSDREEHCVYGAAPLRRVARDPGVGTGRASAEVRLEEGHDMRVRIAQCLCGPERHAIMAFALDDDPVLTPDGEMLSWLKEIVAALIA